jgi:Uma2 family endonuclease
MMVALSKQQQSEPFLPAPLSYRDWLELPEDDRRLELWNGALIVSPSPSDRHQDIQAQLGYNLMAAVLKHPTAKLFYERDVRLSDHTVVQPDIVVFTGEAGGKRTQRAIIGPPDLVVEIVSPSSRSRDFIQKSALYAEAGVPEYWLIDPDAQQLIIGRLRDGQYEREIFTEGPVRCEALGGAMIDISAIAMTEVEDFEDGR